MDETMTTETEYPQTDYDREVMHALADEAYETMLNAIDYHQWELAELHLLEAGRAYDEAQGRLFEAQKLMREAEVAYGDAERAYNRAIAATEAN